VLVVAELRVGGGGNGAGKAQDGQDGGDDDFDHDCGWQVVEMNEECRVLTMSVDRECNLRCGNLAALYNVFVKLALGRRYS
jgi:hypothetical protein